MSLDTPVVIVLTTITTQILKAVGCVGSLYWRHNVSNNERVDCMLNPLFRCRSKKTSKLHVFGLCEGNPLVTGGFPSQRASNTEKASIWWHHHVTPYKISSALHKVFVVMVESHVNLLKQKCCTKRNFCAERSGYMLYFRKYSQLNRNSSPAKAWYRVPFASSKSDLPVFIIVNPNKTLFYTEWAVL